MLEQSRTISEKPWREMTPQEKADYRAARNAEADATVKKVRAIIDRRTLDIIFAGKKTVTRVTAERRLSAKRRAAHDPT
jgi:hypothetical protein